MAINRLWVLGPAIESIDTIECLLRACKEPVAYATHGGQRVTPYNHKVSDGVSERSNGLYYLVECSGPAIRGRAVARIATHRVGDPGFELHPERYLEESSLGQVIELLAPLGHFETMWGLIGKPATKRSRNRFLFSAAADYCLEDARAGRCPGVNPHEFIMWRITNTL